MIASHGPGGDGDRTVGIGDQAAVRSGVGTTLDAAPVRLMVVDDDALIVATLAASLRGAGFEVLEATSGTEALSVTAGDRVDLALLDYRLNDMSGVDVAVALRNLRPPVPCLFLSAYSDEEIVSEAVRAGALGYLVKPVGIGTLLPTVSAALARARDLSGMAERQEKMGAALETNRTISTAVGVLMARHNLTQEQAFERMRAHARARRQRLHDLAREILKAAEAILIAPAPEKK